MKITSRLSALKGDEGFHDVTRPSAFVVAEKCKGDESEEGALCSVRVTGMEAPGRPSVVSRTWQVIGGLESVDIVGGGVKWLERAPIRWVA